VYAVGCVRFEQNAHPRLSWFRQWALKTFNLWHTELAFTEKCIEIDVRNNSAWNQVDHDCFVSISSQQQ
jgi:competence transcription factor ComK